MQHSPHFIDRLLAPAVRLMARFRFGQKALVMGSTFLLTCLVLASVIIADVRHDLKVARLAQSASGPIKALLRGLDAMQAHRSQVQLASLDHAVPAADVEEARSGVNAAFKAVEAWDLAQHDKLAPQYVEAKAAWAKAIAAKEDASAGVAAHDVAIERMRELLDYLDGASGLNLSPDPAIYFESRVLLAHLPALSEAAGREGLVATRVTGQGSIWADDRAQFSAADALQAFLHANIVSSVAQAVAVDPSIATAFATPVERTNKAMAKQSAYIKKHVLDAETPDSTVAAMAALEKATRLSVRATISDVDRDLVRRIDRDVAALRSKAGVVVMGVTLGLLLATYLFFGFTRGTRDVLLRIERGAGALAEGRFDQQFRVDTRDELNEIGRSMDAVATSLRGFAQAQKTLFQQHQTGEIDERMDSGAFPGAFAEMAQDTNTLVESHLQVNARVVDMVSLYARGDLSANIERYPGQQARVSDAVDSVKAATLAVNAEIKALVDAAVAGDFSRRGDAERFEHVYRDLVQDLNRLMVTSDESLSEVGHMLSGIAEGDLTRRVQVELPGQFGQLAHDANRTVGNLSRIVGDIRAASDSISSAAGEIAAGNNDLSVRTEQQAASLEETASSMEELTSTVKQNADNARQANQLAIGAAGVAETGGEIVQKVVDTMGEIQSSSRRIADIIGVIDGIAFQTNILALNAAVEAARAGEQGRGFAVVAAEVRSLAQRSAGAAKEIKELITDSTIKVDEGSALVDKAGKTMGEIVGSVKRVTDIMADISAASQEQSSGIEQVNLSITQMDEGTQQNAALVEEASASAESLRQQASQLVNAVATFRTGDALPDSGPVQVSPPPKAIQMEVPSPRASRKAAPMASQAAAPRTRRQAGGNGSGGDQHWQEF